MDKNMIFLGDNGLTSTSANHIANMAKEMMQNLDYELKNISFVNSSVTIVGSEVFNVLKTGITAEELDKISGKLADISSINSLIAWLREGIKAKETLANNLHKMSFVDWCKEQNIDVPSGDLSILKEPTEDDFIAEMSIGERCKYYKLQAEAAVLGKFIHQNGAYSDARKELMNKLSNPNSVEGTGRDMVLYTYEPSVAKEMVEDVFFEIQKRYREVQAEMNGIRHEISQKVHEGTVRYHILRHKTYSEVEQQTVKLNREFEMWQEERAKEIENLKIIIPHSLQDIYNKVNNLGK